MADEERTEEPTAKKQEDARNKGQIARSKELGTLAVLLSSAVALIVAAPYYAESLKNVMELQFALEREDAFDKGVIFSLWPEVGKQLFIPTLIFFSIVTVGAFIGNVIVGGYNFTWKAIEPKPSKMNPLKGLKRILGLQSVIELIKSIAKFAVVVTVSYVLLAWQFPDIVRLSEGVLPTIFIDALKILGIIFVLMVCSLIVVVIIDVPYQLYKHNEQLKMTKQEVKDERKNAEGNPQVKAKMRSMQLSMLMKRMMQDVPKADVVVTNPTHFAVALSYDTDGRAAPRVIAKGTDDIAARIREVAMDSEVPILQNPLLARALYYTTELGHEIPEGLFMAVAQVLAYVYQLKEYKRGRRKRPKQPAKDLPIPEDMQFDS
ncbi:MULTISPECIES: flagellar biosynthesis protein FlhB [Gammaproteobacteria]|uniref:flagellar biosynthesis protein FlhB n=1 Tax=Gammaproteobacteria TaxID=1236 RepID=UPI000DD0ECDE|nr:MULTISPECIES: flagellar biosynthesis protein FlhB [Gammaproteobacteria]RTE85449.1 flagellar biosynthesis protein FlhB [Aliidiomarina sp. B3213]TCZ89416.1 flagellar biosynthesis protein FlhB [Lysobacter sp. N42]